MLYVNKAQALGAAHEAAEALRLAIRERQPFALYVRPFDSERDEEMPLFAPHTEGIAEDIANRKLDGNASIRVLPRIRKVLPVFSLLNPRGTRPPAATCVDTLDEDWMSLFQEACCTARLLIVGSGAGEARRGIAAEVKHICERAMLDRTMVLLNDGSRILEIYPELSRARWVVEAPAREFTVPTELMDMTPQSVGIDAKSG